MILAAMFAVGVADAGAQAPTCKTADPRVEALVTAQVRKLPGDEYCQARLYHTLDDLDGDGRADFVLVFTVEARDGNRSVQYLTVFPSSGGWKPVVLQVGERGKRYVEQIDVQPGRTLVLRTSEYTPADAMCCPSGKGELKYRLDNGHLTPTDAAPATDSHTPPAHAPTTKPPAGRN